MNMPTTFAGLVNQAKEMNTDVFTTFSVLCSNEQTNRLRNLIGKIKDVQCFKYEGVIYKGNKRAAVIAFIIENPNKEDFAVWLDNNYQKLS